ncbi:Delta-1-pyrroline-5-carboxylate dehydrogenase 12A1, mitochondrial [Dendrobium catenatum]|uniref:Delta-1-pyrroline-5-carboxylate dehydrogenase 12A1, mitochondrial n=1 Tax=Dendrobium catenatum TaxID=906689 RepID=A0A2I0WA80_9ASPA|nr:Delta-1-pyrroline-5-carboxylate dehydrogenase 12A1, mitochondrial [Dendrobium catenatum]
MFRFKPCSVFRTVANRAASGFLFTSLTSRRRIHSFPFATIDAEEISGSHPAECAFLQPFVESLSKCPKHGLHNPLRAPERYLLYGDISTKAAHLLGQPEVSNFFARLIQRVSPKSYKQAQGEVFVTQKFLENFCGDQVRFLARSFAVPGNHLGQQSNGYRWPYGPVAIITPFNFPLEIPLLQLMGALYMGNKPVLKVDSKVCIVMEQMIRLLHECGLPKEDVDFINTDGMTMNKFLLEAKPHMTLFTGSSRVAEKLAGDLRGRVKLEDAGFDWKILGPDVQEIDYVAWVCDQDAYACSGQKCSAQSILFMHENWVSTSLVPQIKELAERRKLEDLTIGPVLTVTTDRMVEHIEKLLEIPGSKLLFGGQPLENHSIPKLYGALKPTALFIPIDEILKDKNFELVTTELFGPFQVITQYKQDQLALVLEACERMLAHLTAAVVSNDPMFLQATVIKLVVVWISSRISSTLLPGADASPETGAGATEQARGSEQARVQERARGSGLSAGAVWVKMLHATHVRRRERNGGRERMTVASAWARLRGMEVLGRSVNGTTYAGIRARTTGAPQNHWFGPAGDPRGAGIGTPEAIKLVWSCHREIIYDIGPIPHQWKIPLST